MKLTVLYSNDCPHCHQLLESFEKDGPPPGKELDLVEISTDRGKSLMETHNITQVPTILSEDNTVCVVYYLDGHADVVCP